MTPEERLSGWRPRPPSPQIEQALFETPARQESPERRPDWTGQLAMYLNPMGAFAALVMIAMWLDSPVVGPAVGAPSGNQVATLTNSSPPAFNQMYHHSALNHCDYLIFGWTNLSSHREGIAHFSSDRTTGNTE